MEGADRGSVGVFVHQYVCVYETDSERKIVFCYGGKSFQTRFQSVSEIFKNSSFISNMNVRNISFATSVNLHLN